MYGCDDLLRPLVRKKLTAIDRDAEVTAQERLRSGRAKADHKLRSHYLQFGFEPRPAGGNLDCVRFGMNAALAALRPLEVLYGISDVNFFAVQARFFHCFAQQASGRTDKRVAFAVFFIARLLSHHDDLGVRRSFSEHDLRRPGIEITAATSRSRRAQGR